MISLKEKRKILREVRERIISDKHISETLPIEVQTDLYSVYGHGLLSYIENLDIKFVLKCIDKGYYPYKDFHDKYYHQTEVREKILSANGFIGLVRKVIKAKPLSQKEKEICIKTSAYTFAYLNRGKNITNRDISLMIEQDPFTIRALCHRGGRIEDIHLINAFKKNPRSVNFISSYPYNEVSDFQMRIQCLIIEDFINSKKYHFSIEKSRAFRRFGTVALKKIYDYRQNLFAKDLESLTEKEQDFLILFYEEHKTINTSVLSRIGRCSKNIKECILDQDLRLFRFVKNLTREDEKEICNLLSYSDDLCNKFNYQVPSFIKSKDLIDSLSIRMKEMTIKSIIC